MITVIMYLLPMFAGFCYKTSQIINALV